LFFLIGIILVGFYSYINTRLTNISYKKLSLVASVKSQIEQAKKIAKEYHEMLSSLKEGILVIKDDEINFANDIFYEILANVCLKHANKQSIFKTSVFKIYRRTKEVDSSKNVSVGSKFVNSHVESALTFQLLLGKN